jgi:DnaJ domain
MPNLIAGLFLLYLLLAGIKQFARVSPAVAAKIVRGGGGFLGLLGALLLVLRGSLGPASLLASLALGLAGWGKYAHIGALFRSSASARRKSTARSAMVEMILDHDTGDLSGRILSGAMQGRLLASLSRPECASFYETLQSDDPEGARLLETYLDRRFAGWRDAEQGQGDSSGRSRGGAMTRQEAYEILGLAPGAEAEAIVRAHRALMKKLHPDHGGSTALAARVNQAKDVLLRRH